MIFYKTDEINMSGWVKTMWPSWKTDVREETGVDVKMLLCPVYVVNNGFDTKTWKML